ncbi:MAG TPA: O-antigen ligase family protein [Candidatus Moranbacteria bacterium]|nr:O-antigen ligase family protein [Candidatus Moranbacteria bacterium]HRZ33597.1 O-antigen ligase family protein [Candidatus Moranbacteria bacterium]
MFYKIFLIFCAFLPFQFALNPLEGVDLAVSRIIIPLLFIFWIIISIKNKYPLIIKNKITYSLVLFALLAVISLCFSQKISWSLKKLMFLFSLMPVYFIAAHLFYEKYRQRKIIIALVAGAGIISLFGLFQFASQFIFGIDFVYSFLAEKIAPFFLGNSFSKEVLSYPSWLVNSDGSTYMRTIANFPDPHMFSYYLEMLMPWSLVLWATATKYKKAFLLIFVSILLADIFTFTRGSYVAIIAGTLTTLPLVSRRVVKKLLAGVLFFVLLIMLVPHNPVAGRLISTFDVQEGSNKARISNWQQALEIITEKPLGVGIGAYSLEIKPDADYREPIYAHNLYLDIASELGVLATGVFLFLLLYVFIVFWKNAKKNPFFIAGVASITIFSIHSLFENPLFSVHVLILFFIIIALSSAVEKYE